MEMTKSPVKEHLNIIYRPHPILPAADCKFIQHGWQQGQTVREILIANGIDQHQPISIIVNDRLLTVAEWDTYCPDNCSIINVKAEVLGGGGGGGGSNPVQIVAMVAVVAIAVAAPYLAPAAWGTLTAAGSLSLTGALLTAGIMVAGNLLVGAIFSPKVNAVDLGDISGSTNEVTPTYSLSGGSNQSRPYQPMPIIFGTHRFFPDNAVKPYTEFKGEDQYLYQIFHLGLTTTYFSDWKIGTNPITNYQNYTWYNKDSQGKITGFPGNVDSAVGSAVEQSAGWIIRTTSSETFKIGIDLEATIYYANNSGGLDQRSVNLEIQYKLASSSTWINPTSVSVYGTGTSYDNAGTITMSGASQTPRRATLQWNVSPGVYDVRIRRTTADSTDSRLADKTNWSVIKSYQLDQATYIGQNRIGLEIKASDQLNGQIQQLSATGSSSAYYFNGSSWVTAATSNPAHWFMDFARGKFDSDGKLLYGIGLTASQLDLGELTAWATFCANEGLSFNAVVDGTQTAADILTAITRCGFASPTWASGKLGVVYDARNKAVTAAFGMSNIIKGSFEVRYLTEQLADEIVVRYVNANKDWAQDEVRVMVPGVTNPLRSTVIDVLGCTNTAMAGKFANYIAAQQYYRRRRITWDCDFEGFVCQRGDVVLLSHDLTQWGYSGRIVSITGNVVTLDRDVPRNGSIEYIMLKDPDGSMTTYSVSSGTGNTNQLTLTSTPTLQSDYLPMDHMWFFSPLATPGKKVKIISVQPLSDSRIQVVATDEDPEFYAAWDGAWIEPPQKTILLSNVPVVSNVRHNEEIYLGPDSSVRSKVTISWDAVGVWERSNVRYRIGSNPWTEISVVKPYFEFDTNSVGRLDVTVLPIYGLTVGSMVTSEFYVYGVTRPLSNITNFLDYFREGKTILTWTRITDPRVIDYEIRKGLEWDKAQILGRVINNEFITDGDGTYWVAAHTGNLYSPNPTSIVIEGSTLVANVVATYDEEATGWTGTLGGGAVIDGTDIILSGDPIATSGSYEIPVGHIVDIGTAQACNVSVTYRMYADSPFNIFSLIPVFSEIPSLVGKYAGLADVKIQIAIAPDSGVFADWRDFIPGTYFGRKFKFRALLYSYDGQVTAILDKMTFTIDMPDRFENGTNVSATAGGISVTYAKPFQITPNVQVTVIDAVANDDIVLSNEDETGFDVKIINGALDVTRNINWIAQGY